jgi:hypothetical protein
MKGLADRSLPNSALDWGFTLELSSVLWLPHANHDNVR